MQGGCGGCQELMLKRKGRFLELNATNTSGSLRGLEPGWAMCIEKQLEACGWTHRLGGERSQVITRAGQIELARLMETQVWRPPASASVWRKPPLQPSPRSQTTQSLPVRPGTFHTRCGASLFRVFTPPTGLSVVSSG